MLWHFPSTPSPRQEMGELPPPPQPAAGGQGTPGRAWPMSLEFVHLLQVCRREGAGLSEEEGRGGGR